MLISEKIDVTKGSDNVFEDLGFSPTEAMNLKIRADLIIELRSFILEKGWTQQETAQFFNETQPRISKLMNGDISFFLNRAVLLLELLKYIALRAITPFQTYSDK